MAGDGFDPELDAAVVGEGLAVETRFLAEAGGFVDAEGVVGFDVDFLNMLKGVGEFGNAGEVFDVVIEVGNERATQDGFGAGAINAAEVAEDLMVINTGKAPVFVGIGGFDVVEKEINDGDEAEDFVAGALTAGFDAGVETGGPGFAE